MGESRAYVYRGERIYVEGVPLGGWQNPGDHYVSASGPLWEGDEALIDPKDLEKVGWLDEQPGIQGWRHVDQGEPSNSLPGGSKWQPVYRLAATSEEPDT